jgi:Helicase conserved C-terminal domain
MNEIAAGGTLGAEEATRFQCDLYRYWRATSQSGALRLGAHRYLTRSARRQLCARLDLAGDTTGQFAEATELADQRLYFIRRLLERLSLLRRDPELGLIAGPREEVERYFGLPLDERLRLLVRLWLGGGWWVERPDERQEPPGIRAPAHPSVAVGRRQALQALLDADSSDVVAIDRLPLRMERADVRPEPPVHWGTRARRRAAPPVQSDTIASALLGPLCWIGLAVRVDGPLSPSGAPELRVTSALDALRPVPSGGRATVVEEAAGPVVVGADFEVLAYPPLSAGTLLTLDMCGDPVGSGIVARYHLVRSGLVRARRAGWAAGEVAARLSALAGKLPPNVEITLADWERQADRIRLRTDVALLQVRIPRLLDALATDATLGRAVVRKLGPCLALIRHDGAEAVRNWLLRRGEFPAVTDGDGP